MANLLFFVELGKICGIFVIVFMRYRCFCILFFVVLLAACGGKRRELTPWGSVVGGDSAGAAAGFSFDDMLANGEMIMLTLTGPDSYFDYRGRGMGLQFLLCERFAQSLGVGLRVEVCRDTAEMVDRLKHGEGDVIGFLLPATVAGVQFCGVSEDGERLRWAVREDNIELAERLDEWFRPELVTEVCREEAFLLSGRGVRRRVYSPILDRGSGIISHYDGLFRRYAVVAGMDWRLMAAQCYQESTFDTNARSWAGACGLMQIMPGTAAHLGLGKEDVFNAERNVEAASRYLRELWGRFNDIGEPMERWYFVLASYNGGFFHIRDAMALARKYGRNAYRWGDVSEFVEKLSDVRFYRDGVVKYGYMRGGETVDYVRRIRARYLVYRNVAARGTRGNGDPQRAKGKYRFDV